MSKYLTQTHCGGPADVYDPHRILTKFRGFDIHVLPIPRGIGSFLVTLGISMALGVDFSRRVSLVKHLSLNRYHTSRRALWRRPHYRLFSLKRLQHVRFCGIALKQCASRIISRRTQRATKHISPTLVRRTEYHILIYLGLLLSRAGPLGTGHVLRRRFPPLGDNQPPRAREKAEA
jgi:hypothetical protein